MAAPPFHVQALAVAALAGAALVTLTVPLSLDMERLAQVVTQVWPRRGQPEQAPAPPPPPDPLVTLDPATREALLSSPPSGFAFLTIVTMDPADFCAALTERGIAMGRFGGGPLESRAGLCVSDLIAFGPPRRPPEVLPPADETGEGEMVEAEPEPGPSTLFLAVHGDGDGRLSRLRLKINLEDRDTATAAKARAVDIVKTAFALMDADPPDGLYRSIDHLDTIDTARRGIHVTMRREWGEVPRFNLFIDLPQINGALPVGRFG